MRLTRPARSAGFSPLQQAVAWSRCVGFDDPHRVPNRSGVNAAPPRAAFTLVEIAISMAIIGFAVVAIIGVLPLGLNVQKENREETIINNEANFYMDAIRNGARGLDDLTNHVFAITNYWTRYNTSTDPWTLVNSGVDGFTRTSSSVTSFATPAPWLDTGSNIVGLLSTPRFTGAGQSNYVVAYAYAMSGSAGEQLPQSTANRQNFAFAHRMIVEIVPVPSADANDAYRTNLVNNLHEIRILFRWPVYPNGKTGSGRQTYRTVAGGRLLPESLLLWYFRPELYTQAK